MTNIFPITSQKIKNGEYKDIFPEFYELANSVENGSWHVQQNVFDHVTSVFENLEKILEFDVFEETVRNFLDEYLSQQIGSLSRREILTLATFFHDIAKSKTNIVAKDGKSSCPGHELIGAGMIKNFAKRIALGSEEEKYLERIVRYHGLISDILTLILANGKRDEYIDLFRDIAGDIDAELLLLMRADLLGSDLAQTDQKGFDDRLALIDSILQDFSN